MSLQLALDQTPEPGEQLLGSDRSAQSSRIRSDRLDAPVHSRAPENDLAVT